MPISQQDKCERRAAQAGERRGDEAQELGGGGGGGRQSCVLWPRDNL